MTADIAMYGETLIDSSTSSLGGAYGPFQDATARGLYRKTSLSCTKDTVREAVAAHLHLSTLPSLHKDPFDRLLVSQSICKGLVILTAHPPVHAYPARREW